jgi:hypothetical protein
VAGIAVGVLAVQPQVRVVEHVDREREAADSVGAKPLLLGQLAEALRLGQCVADWLKLHPAGIIGLRDGAAPADGGTEIAAV